MKLYDLQKLAQSGELAGKIFYDITDEVYHDYRCPGMTNSQLFAFRESPFNYYHQFIEGIKPEESKAFRVGKMVHSIVLEPELFKQTYSSDEFALRLGSRRTNRYKEAIDGLVAKYPGIQIVDTREYVTAERCLSAITKNELTKELLFGEGDTEVTLFWTDPETQILCKTKIDKIKFVKHFFVELKTIQKTILFDKNGSSFDYFVQAAWNQYAIEMVLNKVKRHLFIVVGTDVPHPFNIIFKEYPKEDVLSGFKEFKKTLVDFKKFQETNTWKDGIPDFTFQKAKVQTWRYYAIESRGE